MNELPTNQIGREPIGYLIITEYLRLAIYKPINGFRRFMMKLCFGWTYEPQESEDKK